MSSFTRPLSTTQLKPRWWRVDEGFRYYVGAKGSDYYFDVEAGFEYDGGSIPRFAWWLDAPNGDGAQAYCLHDALYGSGLVPRAEADRILDEGLAVKGLSAFRRGLIYSTVRAVGWLFFKKRDIKERCDHAKTYVTMHGGPYQKV